MARYLANVSYDGTAYLGWQTQPGGGTIQDIITTKLAQILNQADLKIEGSGRTDAGVHAYGQTFHFSSIKPLDVGQCAYALNCLLPSDIHINSIVEVKEDFHARISATGKHYRYIIATGPSNPFLFRYRYELKQKLNVSAMQVALEYFIGEHNFKSFTTKTDDFQQFIRLITKATLQSQDDELIIDFFGSGFMRYQVRMMVGLLIEVGLNKMAPMSVKTFLDKPSHPPVIYKAPASGLYLMEVFYE